MSEPALLADYLDQQSEAILEHWRASVESDGDVPEAKRLPRQDFLDHIPLLLERLADRLRGRPADAAAAGQCHGQHRWKQGYGIAEVVTEFGHLRGALAGSTGAFARKYGWDLVRFEEAIGAINAVLDEATAESVKQFQEDSRKESQAALADLKTRQKSIEEAWVTARLERAKLRTVLRSLPAAVWVIDADGTVIGANEHAEKMQGFAMDERPVRPNIHRLGPEYELLHQDGSPVTDDFLPGMRALRGETVEQDEYVWNSRSGSKVVGLNAATLNDATGEVIGAVVVGVDLTGRKRLEAELAASESRFRLIAERSPMMIWQTDPGGRCAYVNPSWCEFRGLTEGGPPGEAWADGIHNEDRARCLEAFRQALAEKAPFELSYRVLRYDGEYRWVSDRANPLFDVRGAMLGFLGSSLDVTPRIELEEVLQRQRTLAEESSRHKTRLVSALSHDVRTPLNAVVLAAQLLEVHLDGATDGEVQGCLTTIRHSVRNVLDLLGDLLDLSKIEAGGTPTDVSRFPLEQVLAECLASIEPQARQKGLAVVYEPGNLNGVSLESDRSKLKQVLSNLLSNALRYTDAGRIRLFGERTAEFVRIGVEDTGVGIGLEDQERIFDEFAVLEHPGRKPGEGTGLGLAICRRLAALLGARIELASARGAGSTFALVLPPSALTLSTPPQGHAPLGLGGFEGAGAVLIAEDHSDSRQTLAKVLRRMGFRVLEANDGREAVDAALSEPDLRAVLMDVNMPVMDGVEATQALRADPRLKNIPIFALTGDVTTDNQRRIGEAGVNGFLEKPVTWEALRKALDSVGNIQLR